MGILSDRLCYGLHRAPSGTVINRLVQFPAIVPDADRGDVADLFGDYTISFGYRCIDFDLDSDTDLAASDLVVCCDYCKYCNYSDSALFVVVYRTTQAHRQSQ